MNTSIACINENIKVYGDVVFLQVIQICILINYHSLSIILEFILIIVCKNTIIHVLRV